MKKHNNQIDADCGGQALRTPEARHGRVLRRDLPRAQPQHAAGGRRQARAAEVEAPPAGVRGQAVGLPQRGRGAQRVGPAAAVLLREERGVQHHGDGPAGPVPRGPLPEVQPEVRPEDGGGSGEAGRDAAGVHALAQVHPPRHQAGELPDRHAPALQPRVRDRLRALQEVHPEGGRAHRLQGQQEPHGHAAVRLDQQPPGHRAEPPRRPGERGLHAHLLPQGLPPLAEPQERPQLRPLREDPREEALRQHRDPHPRAAQRVLPPRRVHARTALHRGARLRTREATARPGLRALRGLRVRPRRALQLGAGGRALMLHRLIIIMSSEHEATVDICLNLQAVRNIGEHYLSRSYFTLALTAGPHLAVPYQIIPQRTPSLSSITLLTYVSPLLSLAPYASYQYSELAVFKALVPISQLESEGLQVSCVLYEASGEEAQEVDRVQLEYVSILGLNSFMPICFMESRCVIDAVITTQLLTCRFKNILTLPKPLLYCAIEALLIAFNRLREKLHKCRQSCEFEVENFPELEDIRRFTKIRIFQYPEEEQRAKLLEFERKIPNISFCVQQLWSQYLSCELSSDLERYRSNFLKSYALQVKQNVFVREKAEEATYIVDGLRVFSSPISVKTLFKREAESFQKGDGSTQHLLILVHGYGASSKTLEQLELALRCFFPHLLIITSKINENRTDDSLDELGKRLSLEVESSMLAFKAEDNFSLSFIAHSMGGLIVRAALKYLEAHKYSMRLFISLGTPHLGFLYHNSRMTKFGMWAYNLLKKSPSMGAMMMDNPTGNYRSSYLYALSNAVGLDWFEEALFYAGSEDYYVSEESALVETNAAILEDQGRGLEKPMIWQEMRENLEKSLQHVGVGKYLVDFEKSNELEEGSLFDEFLGRRNHINLATSGAFVIALLLNHSNLL